MSLTLSVFMVSPHIVLIFASGDYCLVMGNIEAKTDDNIGIFPNPSSGQITINLGSLQESMQMEILECKRKHTIKKENFRYSKTNDKSFPTNPRSLFHEDNFR
jgi:hypothetical protein